MRLSPAPLRKAHGQYRSLATFVERDIVLLCQQSNQDNTILTRPLNSATKISTHKGDIRHSDIIGKAPRDVIKSSTGYDYRVHGVTLADYVSMTRRLVTPIYPADANLIVSLLDLHPSQANEAEKLEILEAGTGHGALTLHLSRAIHAANPPKPAPAPTDHGTERQVTPESGSNSSSEHVESDNALASWKASRKAVVHSIDISPKYSMHAAKVVAGFRHGIYAGNVDFHVGDASGWIKSEFSRRNSEEPLLTHAFLDLPASHDHLATVASALKVDGTLIVFNPSITQIVDCVHKIKRQSIPLFLDQTLELGNNGTSGGKPWDLRAVKPRSSTKAQTAEESTESALSSGSEGLEEQDQSITRDPVQTVTEASPGDSNWTFVCRPKVGGRVIGGGFLGVFRKMNNITRP